mmetsp:Transcript_9644/g.22154  ORF Transcript_9644/g.22154 Transcript_9644/m.22154 type:complete len:83 (+) Transcript_9644:222-470(+)
MKENCFTMIQQGESMFSAKTETSTAGTKTSEQEKQEQTPPTEHDAGQKEQMASTVVACSGKFRNVRDPWPQPERFDGADFSC